MMLTIAECCESNLYRVVERNYRWGSNIKTIRRFQLVDEERELEIFWKYNPR